MAQPTTVPIDYTFRDAKGVTGRMRFWVQFDALLAASIAQASNIGTEIANILLGNGNVTTLVPTVPVSGSITNGALVAVKGPSFFPGLLDPSQLGLILPYLGVEYKAELTFLAADHTLHKFSVPAPNLNFAAGPHFLFQADQVTVDELYPSIVALVAQVLHAPFNSSFVCTRTGSPFVGFVGGVLIRRKAQRKITLWRRTPELTEPEE